ncbi:MAG: transcriptional regulator [Thermomicrobiales bacterium]|nr:MAG: transcriptional regulator [Thermomicrobiales bacterium]
MVRSHTGQPMTRTQAFRLRSLPPAVLAWLRLARIYHKLDRASAQHLRSCGLSVAQFDVIAHIGANEGLSQQELAQALLVTKGNVCQLLDRLERQGLIERRPAGTGRANRLYLTEEGRRLHDLAVPAQEAMIASQLAGLTMDEQQALVRLLGKLDRSIHVASA